MLEPLLQFEIEMERTVESTQEVQEVKQNTDQPLGSAHKIWEWAILLFDGIVLILSEFAAHDNRWYS